MLLPKVMVKVYLQHREMWHQPRPPRPLYSTIRTDGASLTTGTESYQLVQCPGSSEQEAQVT